MKSKGFTSGSIEELLVIDYSPQAVAFERHPVLFGDIEHAEQNFPLRLPTAVSEKPLGSSAGILQAVADVLSDLERRGRLKKTAVLIGHESDPFLPFRGKCDLTLRLLQLIAGYDFARLNLQTRSPLVLLAVPLLKALRDRAVVTFAVESLNDDHFANTPRLPRRVERLTAAKTLRGADIFVCVQAAPLVPVRSLGEDIGTYARELLPAADRVRLHDAKDVGEYSCADNATTAALSELPAALARDALEKMLLRLAPEKLVGAPDSAEITAIRA